MKREILKQKISKRHYVLLTLSIAWVIFICWCIWFRKKPVEVYLYECQIQNTVDDIIGVVFAAILPSVLMIAIYVCSRRRKFILLVLLIVLSIFTLPICVLVAFFQGSLPDRCSYTTDIANLGSYDKYVDHVEWMPTMMPDNIEDTQYNYFYVIEGGSSRYYISASWRFVETDDFKTEMKKYENMMNWGTEVTEEMVTYDLTRYGSAQVIFDIVNQTVFYVNASYGYYIPETIEELEAWSPQKSYMVSPSAKIVRRP